ncbi:MAG: hypothetical protein IJ097_03130 [Bacilli bacterium]|nr:hypothetical protein [Bacilli bacterium]
MAYLLGAEIKEIYLYPLGGITKFNIELNISMIKEIMILIMGPIFQFIAYYILLLLLPDRKELIKTYHYSILIFNLLPIYPLDGGKLLNIFFNTFISYKKSLKVIIKISYIVLAIIFIYSKKNINIFIMIVLLIILIEKERKKINYIYNKFLLERYLNNYNFKKCKITSNINNFHRSKRHLIYENNKYYLEKEMLNNKYKKI